MVSTLSFLFPLSPPPPLTVSHCVACYFSLFFQLVSLIYFFSQYIGLLFFHRFFSPSVNSLPISYILFPSPRKSFQFFGQFFQSIYSVYFFNLFFLATFLTLWVSSITSLYQILHSLPPPLVFQSFSQLFPFFLYSLPLPWEFFTLLDIFF